MEPPSYEDDVGQGGRHLHLQRFHAPEQADRLPHHQRQAERDHQKGVPVPPVQPTEDAQLERRAKTAHQDGGGDQREPKLPVRCTADQPT